jgi:predicted nucleotidyltransferase
MNSSEALATLRRSEPGLRARGVRRAAVFGSVARGDGRPDSDIDIMVEIDPEARLTVFDYAGLKDYIASLLAGASQRAARVFGPRGGSRRGAQRLGGGADAPAEPPTCFPSSGEPI